jgi:NADH-quinone oxidoreductase subunit N
MSGVQLAANSVPLADLRLLVPELILLGTSLLLILAARRVRNTPVPAVVTVLAGLAAAIVACWSLSTQPVTGFGGMIVVDGYATFFKVLIAATLALTTLLSVRGSIGERVPRSEYHTLLMLASIGMMLAVSAVDLLVLYLGLELLTLCSYILVGISVEKPTANEAAIKYFLLAQCRSGIRPEGGRGLESSIRV